MTTLNEQYQNFTKSTISKPSSNYVDLVTRLFELENNTLDVKLPELLTASFGLSAEGGEFGEILKKMVFQGKPLNEDNIYHMKRELGDICYYLVTACTALNTTLDEILKMNIEKLSARYPDGFEILKSEERKIGDI
jgi:NTP pyrophosphatase (non-canonical NTP hydrolase)